VHFLLDLTEEIQFLIFLFCIGKKTYGGGEMQRGVNAKSFSASRATGRRDHAVMPKFCRLVTEANPYKMGAWESKASSSL
jgi:hypothetical protein